LSTGEFTAADANDTFPDYLAREDSLFREVKEMVAAARRAP